MPTPKIPDGFENLVRKYLQSKGITPGDVIDGRVFRFDQWVVVRFADGSHATFRHAFFLQDPQRELTAVFTEHCGYHVFSSVELEIHEMRISATGIDPLDVANKLDYERSQTDGAQIQPLSTTGASVLKSLRLRALQDSPMVFGSTYASESQLTDQEWAERAAARTGDKAINFIAWEDSSPCGIAAGVLDPNDSTRAFLRSFWVAPAYRREGIGRRLVTAVREWASSRGADKLYLHVTSQNEAAIAFYEKMGFVRTGKTEPYPKDPKLLEYEMVADIPRGSPSIPFSPA